MNHHHTDCDDHRDFIRRRTAILDRRFFLRSGAIAFAGINLSHLAPSFISRAVAARDDQTRANGRRKTLVAIFLRGAIDGLNMIVPHGEARYYDLRPTISIPAPGKSDASESALNLDGFFGLHPAMRDLKPLWDARRLAIVNAAGSPANTRSHFDAQDYMETATPDRKSTPDGWLNRLAAERARQDAATSTSDLSSFRLVSVTPALPRAMQGASPALAIPNLRDFRLRGADSALAQNGFEDLYAANARDRFAGTGRETFDAVDYLRRLDPARHRPAANVNYPRGKFGDSLMQIAQLIKSDVGLEIAFTEIGGWDTHINQGAARGQLAVRLSELARGLAALTTDLGARMDDVVILTMSEFGRTAAENGTRGTDHGHANAMLVIGNTVRGGQVLGDWRGLAADKLHEERDLALTTDFRDVFAEIASRHLKVSNLSAVFPGYTPQPSKFRGVLG